MNARLSVLVAFILLATSVSPAFAWKTGESAEAICEDGEIVIRWSFSNKEPADDKYIMLVTVSSDFGSSGPYEVAPGDSIDGEFSTGRASVGGGKVSFHLEWKNRPGSDTRQASYGGASCPVPNTPTPVPNTPTPVSPSPTPMDTPLPTATDLPTSTATATTIPTNTSTPTATERPTEEPTPTPTSTGTLPPSPTATDTPLPTATDLPTSTATSTPVPPSPTAMPTGTPEPTATPAPTEEPSPTPTGTLPPSPTPTDPPPATPTTPPPTAIPTQPATRADPEEEVVRISASGRCAIEPVVIESFNSEENPRNWDILLFDGRFSPPRFVRNLTRNFAEDFRNPTVAYSRCKFAAQVFDKESGRWEVRVYSFAMELLDTYALPNDHLQMPEFVLTFEDKLVMVRASNKRLLEISNGEVQELPVFGSYPHSLALPDGSYRLAYRTLEGKLGILLENGQEIVKEFRCFSPEWDPFGSSIYCRQGVNVVSVPITMEATASEAVELLVEGRVLAVAMDPDGSGRAILPGRSLYFTENLLQDPLQEVVVEDLRGWGSDWGDTPVTPRATLAMIFGETASAEAETVASATATVLSPNGSREAFIEEGELCIRWTFERSDGLPQAWCTGVQADSVDSWSADWVITITLNGQSFETDQFASFLRVVP